MVRSIQEDPGITVYIISWLAYTSYHTWPRTALYSRLSRPMYPYDDAALRVISYHVPRAHTDIPIQYPGHVANQHLE